MPLHPIRRLRAAAHRHSLHGAVARYQGARRSLGVPASGQSRRGLDWMNFFLADVQTGFGTFVAFYLAHVDWSPSNIGLALTIGSLAGVLTQVPGGVLADAVTWKRALVAIGIALIGVAALIIAFVPSFTMVVFSEILHGITAGLVTPAIAAISLGLVGRSAMSLRTGRNYRYAAAGHALTAAAMGMAGTYIAESAIFVSAALLCVPALIALSFIRSEEISYARARNAGATEGAIGIGRIRDLVKNRSLLLFGGALVLFQLADASMLPLIGEHLGVSQRAQASLWMSGLIIAPQIVVAILAPWVGYHSEKRGRRPLLLIGFGLEAFRAAFLAFAAGYAGFALAQVLDGITGAIVGVLTVVVVTDLTAGTGRFNLARGAIGALVGIAASVSTVTTGLIFEAFGRVVCFAIIGVVACAATGVLWIFLSETKPHYEELRPDSGVSQR
jgi:MFS family permease